MNVQSINISLDIKNKVKRIIIYDRSELGRAGFASLMAGEAGLEVIECDDRSIGSLVTLAQHRPDVLVVADEDRLINTIEALVATSKMPFIMAFANRWDRETAMNALQLGVRGLCVKTESKSTIVAAIHGVAAGGIYLDPTVADGVIGSAINGASTPSAAALTKIAALTDQERRVLTYLANGLATADIANQLTITSATVKSHISHVLQKLQLRDRVQAVVFAHRSGLVSGNMHPSLTGKLDGQVDAAR